MNRKRIFKVSYIGATNTKGSRVKIEDLRNNTKVVIPFNYNITGIDNMAIAYLKSKGIEIDSVAYTGGADYLLSDNFETMIK